MRVAAVVVVVPLASQSTCSAAVSSPAEVRGLGEEVRTMPVRGAAGAKVPEAGGRESGTGLR